MDSTKDHLFDFASLCLPKILTEASCAQVGDNFSHITRTHNGRSWGWPGFQQQTRQGAIFDGATLYRLVDIQTSHKPASPSRTRAGECANFSTSCTYENHARTRTTFHNLCTGAKTQLVGGHAGAVRAHHDPDLQPIDDHPEYLFVRNRREPNTRSVPQAVVSSSTAVPARSTFAVDRCC